MTGVGLFPWGRTAWRSGLCCGRSWVGGDLGRVSGRDQGGSQRIDGHQCVCRWAVHSFYGWNLTGIWNFRRGVLFSALPSQQGRGNVSRLDALPLPRINSRRIQGRWNVSRLDALPLPRINARQHQGRSACAAPPLITESPCLKLTPNAESRGVQPQLRHVRLQFPHVHVFSPPLVFACLFSVWGKNHAAWKPIWPSRQKPF